MLAWNRFASQASESEVVQFENALGVRLPQVYRSYLTSSNGGQPCSVVGFKIGEAGDKVMLGCIYSLCNDGSHVDLPTIYEELMDDIPTGHIPIGEDPGGNPLLLAISGDDSDAIYYWDKIGFFARRFGTKQFRVANDIAEFLASLIPMTTHDTQPSTGRTKRRQEPFAPSTELAA